MQTAALIAYHNDPTVKSAIIVQLEGHRDADEIVKGKYWEDGKGCAVGCTIHSGDHEEYEPRFGIPQMPLVWQEIEAKADENFRDGARAA